MSVTMDTVQIMIFLVTLVLTNISMKEQYYIQIHINFLHTVIVYFYCSSVMEHSTVLLIVSLSLY